MLKITVQEFARRTGIDRQKCYGFLGFLKAAGLAEISGQVRPENGKGKGADVYELKMGFINDLGLLLTKKIIPPNLPTE